MADQHASPLRRPARLSAHAIGLILLLGSAAALVIAHAFERLGGYAPCSLCLRQREVWWATGTLLVGFLVLHRLFPDPKRARIFLALAAIALLLGAGQAFWHAGIEWNFWPGPDTCGAASAGPVKSGSQLLAALDGGIRAVPCDEAAWRLGGISMAGWNGLLSLALAVLALIHVISPRKDAPAAGEEHHP